MLLVIFPSTAVAAEPIVGRPDASLSAPHMVSNQTTSTDDSSPDEGRESQAGMPAPSSEGGGQTSSTLRSSTSPLHNTSPDTSQNALAGPFPNTSDDATPSTLLIGSTEAISPVADDTSHVYARVQNLTNEILDEEIQLLILNTKFRVATTDKGRLKPWRTFLYNLAGAGFSTGGITTIAAERWRTLKDPAKADPKVLRAGPIMLLTSHSIIALGILLEAGLDKIGDYKQHKRGLDAKLTKKGALVLRRSIDEKMSRRDALCASLTSIADRDRSILSAEGKVLLDLRNLALGEYSKFHIRAKRRLAARDASYVNGFASATTGGYLGSLFGLLAVTEKKPQLVGPGGIGFTISGFNIVTGPLVGRAAANVAGRLTARKLKRDLGEIAPAQLDENVSSLKSLSPDGNVAQRLSIYESASNLLKQQGEMDRAEKKKANREFIERCLFNAAIGGTKIGWGIQSMNAGFGFHRPPAVAASGEKTEAQKAVEAALPRFKTPSQLFGQRIAEGATTYMVGTNLWILDTLQARTRGELDVYTMGQQAALPHQKLEGRMSKLKEMESKLKEISPSK